MFFDPSTIPKTPCDPFTSPLPKILGSRPPTPRIDAYRKARPRRHRCQLPLIFSPGVPDLEVMLYYGVLCTMLNLELCWSSPSHLGFTASAVIHTACTSNYTLCSFTPRRAGAAFRCLLLFWSDPVLQNLHLHLCLKLGLSFLLHAHRCSASGTTTSGRPIPERRQSQACMELT